MIAINWLHIGIAALAGLVLGILGNWLYNRMGLNQRRRLAEAELERQREEAREVLTRARRDGEQTKRERLLEVKEDARQVRSELERELRERRSELGRERSRLEQREEALERKSETVERQNEEARERLSDAEAKLVRAEELESAKLTELERIASLSLEEARQQVLDAAEQTYRHEVAGRLRQLEDEARETAEQKAREIVVTTIQRYASDYVSENTVSVVHLPNDEMKGRIIGREGRNIRAIETITGVNVIIDDTPEAVVLSSFDPIRREIARLTMEKLIQDGRIHPTRIEEMTAKAGREIDARIKEEGEKACYETGVIGLHPELVKTLGRLRYRTSYGQNNLQHSIEVSMLAGMMAEELGLDGQMARRAGLLHDIGKAVDFEQEGTHVQLGAALARKYKESATVVNAISSHHGDTEPNSLVSILVAAADALSAARPGARRENMETYIKRIQRLEEIANSYPGVEKSYAIQAGREIRVMVEPERMSEDDMVLTAREICRQIEEELNYPGQIKVNMIRETRVSDYAR